MKFLKVILHIAALLALTACGGGGSSSATNGSVSGVSTAAQISVVTAE